MNNSYRRGKEQFREKRPKKTREEGETAEKTKNIEEKWSKN